MPLLIEDNDHKPKIKLATFPRDVPAKGENRFLSIIIGSQTLVWAWHHGADGNFSPSLFWTTPHLGPEDLEMKPCYALHRFLATQALQYIFGSQRVESATKKSANESSLKRKVPTLSVYIISVNNNPECEKGIEHLFGEIAVKLWKVRNSDFFTPDEGMTPSMSTDRLASLYACRADYKLPVLFVDAGAAISYSALDEKGILMGGGVSPGLNARFRALFDYCSSDDTIPSIDYDTYKNAVNKAMAEKTPIPFFSNDNATGIIASVVSELSGHLRNIIKQFLRQSRPKSNSRDGADNNEMTAQKDPNAKNVDTGDIDRRGSEDNDKDKEKGDPMERLKKKQSATVVISGNDAEVLKPLVSESCSKIIELEPGVTFPPESATVIVYRKNMALYGIEHMLLDNMAKTLDPKARNPDDELRERITGLRAAKGVAASTAAGDKKILSTVYRGTVLSVTPGKALEDDLFQIVYDDDACGREYVDFVGLYDLLVYYAEVGEKSKERDQELWAEQKLDTSKEVQADMERNPKVKHRKAELEKAKAKDGSIASVVVDVTTGPPNTKKRKKSESSKTKIPNLKSNPKKLIGNRVAKFFGKEVFFGTIESLVSVEDNPDDNPDEVWWHIHYDDDDSEDMDQNQVRIALSLYQKKSDQDKRPNIDAA